MMKKFDAINVIPFVDILLVLLAIVLMSSSFITKQAIGVDLPKSSSKERALQEAIVISINEEGSYFWEKEAVDLAQLHKKLENTNRQTPISIACDKKTAFEYFVALMEVLKAKAFEHIDIIAQS